MIEFCYTRAAKHPLKREYSYFSYEMTHASIFPIPYTSTSLQEAMSNRFSENFSWYLAVGNHLLI